MKGPQNIVRLALVVSSIALESQENITGVIVLLHIYFTFHRVKDLLFNELERQCR